MKVTWAREGPKNGVRPRAAGPRRRAREHSCGCEISYSTAGRRRRGRRLFTRTGSVNAGSVRTRGAPRPGKKRAGQNAYRHCLSLRTREATARQIEQLARKIGGDSKDEFILEHARNAARATVDLATVRRVRLALIERALALGALQSPRLFHSAAEARRFLVSIERGEMPMVPQLSGSRRGACKNRSAPPKPFGARCRS